MDTVWRELTNLFTWLLWQHIWLRSFLKLAFWGIIIGYPLAVLLSQVLHRTGVGGWSVRRQARVGFGLVFLLHLVATLLWGLEPGLFLAWREGYGPAQDYLFGSLFVLPYVLLLGLDAFFVFKLLVKEAWEY